LPTVQARQPKGNVSPGSRDENWVTEVITTTRSGARSIIAQPASSANAAATAWALAILQFLLEPPAV
jgi:hypothetical protein